MNGVLGHLRTYRFKRKSIQSAFHTTSEINVFLQMLLIWLRH